MNIYWYTNGEITSSDSITVETVSQPNKLPSIRPGNIDFTLPLRKVTLSVVPDDSSYRYRALMERPQMVLKFSLPHFVEIPVGAWCKFQGQTFHLNSPENLKKQGSRNIEYTVTMGTAQDNLTLYKMRNTVDGRLKYSMCAKPHEFIEEIVKNLNLRDCGEATTEGTWRYDRNLCITANEKTVEFNHTYILEALSQVAQAFETEWEIIENEDNGTFTIALHKVEYLKSDPLDLSYGRGNGFVPGVGRTTQLDALPIKRLYTEGTERNIDRSKNDVSMYGGTKTSTDTTSPELRLPSAQKILYDGSHYAYLDTQGNIIDREDGFVDAAARCYKTDRDGFYIERHYRTGEKHLQAAKEDSLDCSEIYPSHYGTVTRVDEQVKGNPNFFDVYDAEIDSELNFNDYIIEGETMTLIFQSGMLAGKEFEVKYRHDVHKFELVPQEIDGVIMPNEVFKPTVGNEYAIFGIMLPPSYICNNTTHKGAAWDMFREAVRYLYENEEQKFTFTGELQGLWAKRNWERVGGYMKVGAYINFHDPQFAPYGHLIRIIGIKDWINAPYSPTVEIANSVSGGRSVSSSLKKIENTEVVISDTKNELLRFTKRRYRDAKETLEALSDIMGENFSAGINPVTVETMAALIGDESLQFRFVRITHDADKDIYTETIFPYQYSNSSGFHVDHCHIQHLTLNQSLTASRDYSSGNYDVWEMREFPEFYLDPETYGRLFLYAVCPQVGNTTGYRVGEFMFSEEKRTFDDGSNYNLLIGIMSSEYEGERSFVPVYGFTEILPGRITTDRLVSTDGNSWIDLVTGAMQLGDWLKYNVNNDQALHLKFLLAENAELANWIFKGGLLISQKGTVNGIEAEYSDVEAGGKFAGQTFIPNIALDATNGKIMQSSNIVIDDNGISLLNNKGSVAAHISNDSIGTVGELANASETKTASKQSSLTLQYLPSSGVDFRQTVLVDVIDVGFYSIGSSLTHIATNIEFTVPSFVSSTGTLNCTLAQLTVELYRGNTKVATLASDVKTGSMSQGSIVSIASDTQRTVTITGSNLPEGNYSVKIFVTLDLVGVGGSGVLSGLSVNSSLRYSYTKHGYQRTVLGNDGFYTSWALNQYIFANRDGITLRHGESMLKLSADGLEKSTSGTGGLIPL